MKNPKCPRCKRCHRTPNRARLCLVLEHREWERKRRKIRKIAWFKSLRLYFLKYHYDKSINRLKKYVDGFFEKTLDEVGIDNKDQ